MFYDQGFLDREIEESQSPNLTDPSAPTRKQLRYIIQLCKSNGVDEVPEEVTKSKIRASNFIETLLQNDPSKSKRPRPDDAEPPMTQPQGPRARQQKDAHHKPEPPTDKQIRFATDLCGQAMHLPAMRADFDRAMASKRSMSAFISDLLRRGFRATGGDSAGEPNPVRAPQPAGAPTPATDEAPAALAGRSPLTSRGGQGDGGQGSLPVWATQADGEPPAEAAAAAAEEGAAAADEGAAAVGERLVRTMFKGRPAWVVRQFPSAPAD